MGYRLKIDQSELRFKFFDEVTHDEVLQCCVDSAADPRSQGTTRASIDFSDADCCSCSEADLSMIACVALRLVNPTGHGPHLPITFFAPCRNANCARLARLARDGRIELRAG